MNKRKFQKSINSAFLILTAVLSTNLLASNWRIQGQGLSESERAVAIQYVTQVKTLVPQSIREKLDRRGITFKFESLNNHSISENVCANNTQGNTLGRYRHFFGTITLEKQLLQNFANGGNVSIPCGHKNLRKRALAVGIHEVFHAYDKSNFRRQSSYASCPNFTSINNDDGLNNRCKRLFRHYKRQHEISDDLVFQNKAFWRDGDNNNRSPDPYENTNSQEMAAVNFEFFIMDPEYKCRRPALNDYFVDRLGYQPHSSHRCDSVDSVVLGHMERQIYDIDPSRVYQIQYLLASAGDSGSGRFGHSMIKLAVCAPERADFLTGEIIPATPYGPECLKDVDFHIVASFRGNVDELSINTLKGFFGGYESVLYMMRMPQIKWEYNQKEMRDLFAFPLNFTEEQKNLFIKYMLGIYWGYSGDYKLLSVNCATETMQLLFSVFDNEELLVNPRLRPYSILNNFVDAGLLDRRYTRNDFEALPERDKMYGQEHILRRALSNLTGSNENEIERRDLINRFEQDYTVRRDELGQLEQQLASSTLTRSEKRAKIASFIVLEKQALQHFINGFQQSVIEEIMELSDDENVAREVGRFVQEYSSTQQDFLSGGYGIPQNYELSTISGNLPEATSVDQIINLYFSLMEGLIESGRATVREIESNVIEARALMRTLRSNNR